MHIAAQASGRFVFLQQDFNSCSWFSRRGIEYCDERFRDFPMKNLAPSVPWQVIGDLDPGIIRVVTVRRKQRDGRCRNVDVPSLGQISCFNRSVKPPSQTRDPDHLEDKKTRDKAIKNLSVFLSGSSPEDVLSELEMAKLWKGIFYCAFYDILRECTFDSLQVFGCRINPSCSKHLRVRSQSWS